MLTPQQTAQLNQIVPSVGNSGASGGTTGGWYSQIAPSQPQTATQPAPQAPAPSLGNDSMGIGNYAGNAIKQQAEGGVNQIAQNYQDAKNATNPLSKTEAGMGMLAGGISAATAPLAPAIKPVMDAAQWLGEKIGNTKLAQDLVTQHPEIASAISRTATDVGNTSAVLGTAMGAPEMIKGIPDTISRLGDAQSHITNTVKDIPTNVVQSIKGTPPTPEEMAANQAAARAAKVKGIADTWQKPTTINNTSYAKARAVLAKDPSTPQFLAEQGLNPYGHIENERYATADTADALRDTAGHMSSDTLRPSLQAADASGEVEKTPVSEIVKDALANLGKDKGVTPADMNTAQQHINTEGSALAEKYPDGMNLTDLHDNKITYAQNSGYSPIKDPATNLKATANRSLSSVLGDAVESKAPAGIPVKDFNSYLSKYYKGADYLDALDGKKAPVSTLSYLARKGGQLMGVGVGHLVGGGILSDVIGYQVGGALEHAVENMAGHARGQFLENLQKTNPDAYTKVQDYLNSHGESAPK